MQQIDLQAIPNQSISLRLDNQLYDLVIKEAGGIMAVDIARNNVVLQTGIRMVSGTPLLPFKYQEFGNFIMDTMNDEYPYYDQFNITQFLIYASQAELDAL